MTWMLTNFTNFFRLRKAWAIACASCLVAFSARGELTEEQLKGSFLEALKAFATYSTGEDWAIVTMPISMESWEGMDDIINALNTKIGANVIRLPNVIAHALYKDWTVDVSSGHGSWNEYFWDYLNSHSFTNDLGEVETALDVVTNQLVKVCDNTEFVGSQQFEWYMDQLFNGVWMAYNQLSYWSHDSANAGAADVYVQNFDELVWALESNINYGMQDALNQSDVLNGSTSFQETGPSYTNSQDTINARYKYGGDSVSNSVGYLGAVEGLDGLLDPLQGVAQSVSIDELPELPIPSGSSVITFWSGLEIADAEMPDAVVDVAEVLDADLRADIRKVLSVVYSLACGFLLFKRGLREYKYYASLGQTEGEE